MMSKRLTDGLDGPPFVIGCLTVLKQFNSSHTDVFFQFMTQYVKSLCLDGASKWVSKHIFPEIICIW